MFDLFQKQLHRYSVFLIFADKLHNALPPILVHSLGDVFHLFVTVRLSGFWGFGDVTLPINDKGDLFQ